MNNCEKFQEMISSMLDGELTESEKVELKAHIADCAECRKMYDAFASLSAELGSCLDVPADLHEKIMSGMNTADKSKKKKGLIISLRPYIAAAACLVIIVGAVFAMRTGTGNLSAKASMADTAAATAPESCPAAERQSSANGEAYDTGSYATEESQAAVEDEAPQAYSVTTQQNSYGTAAFVPGMNITNAWRLLDGFDQSIAIENAPQLTQALAEQPCDEVCGFGKIDYILDVETENGFYTLNIIFDSDGERLWVETETGYIYLATCTQQEFLDIK